MQLSEPEAWLWDLKASKQGKKKSGVFAGALDSFHVPGIEEKG